MKGEKPAKLCIIAECGVLKEGDDWGLFLKDGSGDSHPDFPKDADIDLKDVGKPWLVWLSGLSAGQRIKGSLVRFPVRAHAWVAGQIWPPVEGA